MTNALSVPLTSRARQAVAEATAYLRGRQSYNGGFCFYRFEYLDEPNLRDTYHAIAALTLLGAEVPRAPLRNSRRACLLTGLLLCRSVSREHHEAFVWHLLRVFYIRTQFEGRL